MSSKIEVPAAATLVGYNFDAAIHEIADRLIKHDDTGRLAVPNRVPNLTPSGAGVQRFSSSKSPDHDYPGFETVTTDVVEVYRLGLAHSSISAVVLERKKGIRSRRGWLGDEPAQVHLASSADFYRTEGDEDAIVTYCFSDLDPDASKLEFRDPTKGVTETLRLATPDDATAFERLSASAPGLVGELRLALCAVQKASLGPFSPAFGAAGKVPHHDSDSPWQTDPHKN